MHRDNWTTTSNSLVPNIYITVQRNLSFYAPALPKRLPKGMNIILEPYTRQHHDALSICALPVLAQLYENARFELEPNEDPDSQGSRINFVSCLVAPQASGKSAMKKMSERMLKSLSAEDDQTNERLQEYNDEKEAAGDRGKKPKNPHLPLHILPPDTTQAAFFENLANLKGRSMFICAPEIDCLRERYSWGNNRSLWRLAFDQDKAGQKRQSSKGVNCYQNLYLNVNMSGTPEVMYRFFKNCEDGTVSRILFCSFQDERGAVYEEDKPRSKANQQALDALISQCMNEPVNEEPYRLPMIARAMDRWSEQKRLLYNMSDEEAVETFRRRCRIIGLRAGAIAFLLEDHKESKVAIDFALWVAEYVFYYQMKFFGQKMNESAAINAEVMNSSALCASEVVFFRISDTYTYRDIETSFTLLNRKGSGYRVTNSRWLKEGLCEPVPGTRDQFRKTKKGIAMAKKFAAMLPPSGNPDADAGNVAV